MLFQFQVLLLIAYEAVSVQRRAWQEKDGKRFPLCPYLATDLEFRWLHVPKTGTSLANTFALCKNYIAGFGDGDEGQAFHTPMPRDVSDHDLGTYVMMLRNPSQRLASAMAYIKDAGPQLGWYYTGGKPEAKEMHALVTQGGTPANDESLAKYIGCQTNMVLGKGCMEVEAHTSKDVDEAKAKIDKMFMVGLTEEWELAVCLFNFRVQGKRYVWNCQTFDTRPTAGKSTVKYDTKGFPTDTYDKALYTHAKKRFKKELSDYNITRDSCEIRNWGCTCRDGGTRWPTDES